MSILIIRWDVWKYSDKTVEAVIKVVRHSGKVADKR